MATPPSPFWRVSAPLTPQDHVRPIATSIEGLIRADREETPRLLQQLFRTDGGTGRRHEGVPVDEPTAFTCERPSCASSMFCELALDLPGVDRDLHVRPADRGVAAPR